MFSEGSAEELIIDWDQLLPKVITVAVVIRPVEGNCRVPPSHRLSLRNLDNVSATPGSAGTVVHFLVYEPTQSEPRATNQKAWRTLFMHEIFVW